MQAADFAPFRKMMVLVAEQYGKPMSPDLIRLYFDGLSHLPIETVRGALNKHLRNPDTGQFMPKIADVIRACDGRTEDAAYAALVELQSAFSNVGAWSSVEFTDKITMAVVRDMGGWPELCGRDAEEWAQFGSKDFVKRYRIYLERGNATAPTYLPGLYERSPQGTTQKPILVGKVLPKLRDVSKKLEEVLHDSV